MHAQKLQLLKEDREQLEHTFKPQINERRALEQRFDPPVYERLNRPDERGLAKKNNIRRSRDVENTFQPCIDPRTRIARECFAKIAAKGTNVFDRLYQKAMVRATTAVLVAITAINAIDAITAITAITKP